MIVQYVISESFSVLEYPEIIVFHVTVICISLQSFINQQEQALSMLCIQLGWAWLDGLLLYFISLIVLFKVVGLWLV